MIVIFYFKAGKFSDGMPLQAKSTVLALKNLEIHKFMALNPAVCKDCNLGLYSRMQDVVTQIRSYRCRPNIKPFQFITA